MKNPALWQVELSKVSQLGQSQDSVTAQLIKLIPIANKFGLYDAADYIKRAVGIK
jgi:hypothetical protein